MLKRSVGLLVAIASLGFGGPEARAQTAGETSGQTCDLPASMQASDLYRALSERAVEVIDRAGRPGWGTDARLSSLVTSDAEFIFVIGDVGDAPTARGAQGARDFARKLEYSAFRYANWQGIPLHLNGCGPYEIDIEFFDPQTHNNRTIKFKMGGGRVLGAQSWNGSFTEGRIAAAN